MSHWHTHGLLLRLTKLSSKDVFAHYLTPDQGRVTIMCKRVESNPKLRQELDFFRLHSLDLFQGRSLPYLRNISTLSSFTGVMGSYGCLSTAYSWLERLRLTVPEHVAIPKLFPYLCHLLEETTPENVAWQDIRLRLTLLRYAGVLSSAITRQFRALDENTADAEKVQELVADISHAEALHGLQPQGEEAS